MHMWWWANVLVRIGHRKMPSNPINNPGGQNWADKQNETQFVLPVEFWPKHTRPTDPMEYRMYKKNIEPNSGIKSLERRRTAHANIYIERSSVVN